MPPEVKCDLCFSHIRYVDTSGERHWEDYPENCRNCTKKLENMGSDGRRLFELLLERVKRLEKAAHKAISRSEID